MALNKIMLIGNLGQDPEVKVFDDGGKIANISVATSEKYKNRNGELVESTEWHNVVFSGKVADVVDKYLHKGSKVYVEGKLTTRKYTDKEGVEKYITEIRAFNMQMLDSKGSNQQGNGSKVDEYKMKKPVAPKYENKASQSEGDDDLPF